MPMHHVSDHDEPDDEPMEELDDPEVLVVAAHIFITCALSTRVPIFSSFFNFFHR